MSSLSQGELGKREWTRPITTSESLSPVNACSTSLENDMQNMLKNNRDSASRKRCRVFGTDRLWGAIDTSCCRQTQRGVESGTRLAGASEGDTGGLLCLGRSEALIERGDGHGAPPGRWACGGDRVGLGVAETKWRYPVYGEEWWSFVPPECRPQQCWHECCRSHCSSIWSHAKTQIKALQLAVKGARYLAGDLSNGRACIWTRMR